MNVSRRHAELRQEGERWIVDLGSTNGVEVNGKHVDRARLRDGDRITIGATEVVFGRSPVVTPLALETDETLLIGKIAFLVLLYLFIVYVVRSATKGMNQAPQESIILGAAEADALRAQHGSPANPAARSGEPARLGETIAVTAPMVVGRDATSGIRLEHDEFVSARHARIEPRPMARWSTTSDRPTVIVNGSKLKKARLAKAGDVIKIGATELQVQA